MFALRSITLVCLVIPAFFALSAVAQANGTAILRLHRFSHSNGLEALLKRQTCAQQGLGTCKEPVGQCCPIGGVCCTSDGGGCCDAGEYCDVVDGIPGCCEVGEVCTLPPAGGDPDPDPAPIPSSSSTPKIVPTSSSPSVGFSTPAASNPSPSSPSVIGATLPPSANAGGSSTSSPNVFFSPSASAGGNGIPTGLVGSGAIKACVDGKSTIAILIVTVVSFGLF